MIMKEDQVRLKALLTEAVRVILKNGLRVNQEISVEGLLGITLDSSDVFLVNINETIRNEMAHVVSPVSQYNSSNSLQSYLPKLFDHPSMANVLGLPLMEGLPSLNISEHAGRNGSVKRPVQAYRRRGSSPGAPPPLPQQPAQLQPPPPVSVFSNPHLSNRTNTTPSAYRPPSHPVQDIDRDEYEPHPKRVHHNITYSSDLHVAPFRHSAHQNNKDAINHEPLTNNQPPDLISGTNNEPRSHVDEAGRAHLYSQSESQHSVRNGVAGPATPGRPHSESSSLPSPLSPPPQPPPYSHHVSAAVATAGLQSTHGRINTPNQLTSPSQLPPSYQEIINTEAHLMRHNSPIPPPSIPTEIEPLHSPENPVDVLRSPANAQHVVGQLVEYFSKTDQEEEFEDKKTPLPSFQSLAKSGVGLPSFSNQFKPLSKLPATSFPSSAAVLGVAVPTKIPPPISSTGPIQTPPSAIISPLKIKVENGTKVIEPTTRGRKPKTPKDTPTSEFRCEYCGRIFTSWSGRYFHMASHTGKYKHTCFLCKKGFMQTRLYNIHLQSHQKEYEKSHPNKSPGSSTTDESA